MKKIAAIVLTTLICGGCLLPAIGMSSGTSTGLYSHINTFAQLHVFPPTPAQAIWLATHYGSVALLDDLQIGWKGLYTSYMYAANPDLKISIYLMIRYLPGYDMDDAWDFANQTGWNFEDFFLHYKVDTWVPAHGWYAKGYNPDDPNATAETLQEARVIGIDRGDYYEWYANHTYEGYREWIYNYTVRKMNYNTDKYVDGIFIDLVDFAVPTECPAYAFNKTIEYYDIAYDEDHPRIIEQYEFLNDMQIRLDQQFGVGNKYVIGNFGGGWYIRNDPWKSLSEQYCKWGEIENTYDFHPDDSFSQSGSYDFQYFMALEHLKQADRGNKRLLWFKERPDGTPGTDRAKIFGLSFFYLFNRPNLSYMYANDSVFSERPYQEFAWNPAVEYNIGQPIVNSYRKADYNQTQGSTEHFCFEYGEDPSNPGKTYYVLAREYQNALVLVKPRPYNSPTNETSATTHGFKGTYYPLYSNGTIGSRTSNVTLRNNEAALLLNPIEINLTYPAITFEEDTIDTSLNLFEVFRQLKGETMDFRYLENDNISITINNNSTVDLEPLANWSGGEILTFFANDTLSEATANITVTVQPVNDPPTNVSINFSDIDYREGEDQPATGNASDVDLPYGDVLTYRWFSNLTGEIGTGQQLDLNLPEGNHTITLNVTDSEGAWCNSSTSLLILVAISGDDDDDDSGPGPLGGSGNDEPEADAGGPYQGNVSEQIVFNGSASADSDGMIIGYRWDFQNDGTYDTDWLTTPYESYSYTTANTYTVKLEVKDDEGATAIDTAIATISDIPSTEDPPVAIADIPESALTFQNISFDGSQSYDPDGEIINYTWDFGDNTTGYGSIVVYLYDYAGTYHVTLSVMDDDNLTNSTTAVITIILDTDGDGWSDDDELLYATDPFIPGDYPDDFDGDHLPDSVDRDDDNDGLEDILEEEFGLNPYNSEDVHLLDILGARYYLLDLDGDGRYDTFYTPDGTISTLDLLEDGRYLIDIDNDGSWDFIYDSAQTSVVPYSNQSSDEGEWIFISLAIMAIVIVVISIGYYRYKKIYF